MFGSKPTFGAASTGFGGGFGAAATSTPSFGAANPTQPVSTFGQAPSAFGAPAGAVSSAGGLFGSNTATNTQTGGLFGAPQPQGTYDGSHIFANRGWKYCF